MKFVRNRDSNVNVKNSLHERESSDSTEAQVIKLCSHVKWVEEFIRASWGKERQTAEKVETPEAQQRNVP